MSIDHEIDNIIDDIRKDRTHGASELARQAAQVIKTAVGSSRANTVKEFLLEQQDIGQRLMSARPAMAPVFNVVSNILDIMTMKAEGTDLRTLKQLIAVEVDKVVEESEQAVTRIASHGSRLIAGGDKIMTHSYSSTVVAVLKEAFRQRSDMEVIVTRSGVGRTGERTARELGLCGIPLTYIDDTAVGLYTSAVDKVIVGADRICADGGVVNGIGTYQLALVSEKAGAPFYVVCDLLKFDPRVRSHDVELEEKEPSEVIELATLPTGTKVKNPYFDITPLEMVTAVVTENGLLMAEEVMDYMSGHSVKRN